VVNGGTINANVIASGSSIGGLTINGGSLTNSGTLEASNGGTLVLSNSTINNQNGVIEVNGATSTVGLVNGVTIQSGTLTTVGGGFLGTGSGTAINLDGSTLGQAVSISGGSTYTASNNSNTNLLGTITDNGNLQLNGGGGANGFVNISSSNVTLQGSGTLTMSTATGGGNAVIQGNGNTLINNNTIQGTGLIGNGGLAVVNGGGTINANVAASGSSIGALTSNGTGGITNRTACT
jgi:hypothetical protein